MKKFLFTLAMLLMAGSAFADNYLYMDDIVLTKNFVQQEKNADRQINVPVKAHFEQWTNAWDVTFDFGEIISRGTVKDASGNVIAPDMVLQGMDMNGGLVNIPVTLTGNSTQDHFIAANTVGGYYYPEGSDPDDDDPVFYGAVKWAPDDYECMFMLILRIPQNFEGGDITISTKFASGADSRPNVEVVPAEYANTPTVKVAHVTVIDNTPTISDDGEKVTAVFDGATTNVELYLKNGEEWVKVDNPYTLPEATDVEQVLVFKAITVPADGAVGQLPAESEEHTVRIAAAVQEQPAPEPTIEIDENYKVTAVVYDEEGNVVERDVKLYTVELDEEGNEVEGTRQEVTNPYNVTQTYQEQKISFVAVTPKVDGESEDTECKPKTFTIPAKEKDYAPTPTISKTEDGTKVQATVNEDGYEVVLMLEGEDGVYAPCANPYTLPAQTYEEQTLNFKAYTKKNGEYYDSPETEVFTVTIPALDKDYAPTPTISKTEDGTKVQATVDKDGYEVVLMLEGENGYAPCDNPYTLPENTSYTDDIVLNFKAYTKKNGEYYDSPETEVFTVTIPHKTMDQAVKPKITFTPDNGGVNVKIEDYTEYTIKVNGTQVDPTRNEHNYYVEKGDVDKNIVVYAKNAPENMIPADTTATYVLAAKTVYNTPNPVIGEPTVNDNDVTFTVTGEGTVTVTVTNGDKTETYTGTGEVEVTIPRTDKDVTYTVNATAKSNKEGYDVINEGTASATVTVPALQTEKPTITYKYGTAEFDENGNVVVDGRYATITITNNDEGENVVIEYSLDGGETWNTYNPQVPVTVSGEGTHTVMARAKAEGKALSEVESVDIKIDKTTSVNELVNGKTVAGVRYFNMAGQEMQEANGITIVVTTYTDGTTSAVKVIK